MFEVASHDVRLVGTDLLVEFVTPEGTLRQYVLDYDTAERLEDELRARRKELDRALATEYLDAHRVESGEDGVAGWIDIVHGRQRREEAAAEGKILDDRD